MAKFRQQKTSFIAGEFSPTAMGRVDLQQYAHACKTLQNMIPFMSGGAYRRPGTYFEDSLDATTEFAPALLSFQVSKVESYAILLGAPFSGANYIIPYRVTTNAGQATKGTVTGTPPWSGRIAIDGGTWGYYDEFSEVQSVQSADVMWLVHPRYKPYKLTRTSQDNFTISAFDSGLSGTSLRDAYPFLAQNATTDKMSISATTVGVGRTLTHTDSGGTPTAFFQSGHVGAIFKQNNAGTIGACKVTAVAVDGKSATVDVIVAYGATTGVTTWWESAWSDYQGWPRSVSFYQQRLVYGGNSINPDTLWFSQLKNFGVMSKDTDTDPTAPATTTSAFIFEIAISEQLNLIQWISSEKTLVVGTSGDEWLIEPVDAALGVFGGNLSVQRQSSYGSSYVQAVRKADELIFCDRAETELRGLVFNQDQQSYVAEPLQSLYDEFPYSEPSGTTLGNRKIKRFAWDDSRKTLWCVDTAGKLRGDTRDRQIAVNAWHSHQFGGFDSEETGSAIDVTGSSDFTTDPAYIVCAGSALSLAVVPNPLIGTNDIWFVVKRKISGAFVYHIERMIGRNYPFDTAYTLGNPEGSYFVDAAAYVANIVSVPQIVNDVFSGLDHLEGETPVGTAFNTHGIFKVTGSDVVSGDTTLVSTSAFHLDTETTVVVMGLPYDSIVEPVRPEAGSQIGTAQGGIKRLHQVTPRFYRTLAAKLGRDAATLETLVFRTSSTPIGKSAELYTGDKSRPFNGTYDKDGYIYVLQDQPLPFALVSLSAEGLEYDGG
jgi:hypothetical protein